MSKRDKRLWLLILALFFLSLYIVGWMEFQVEYVSKMDQQINITPQVIISTIPSTPEFARYPCEAEKIETSLIEQGYFNDEIPLTYELQDITQMACERSKTVSYSLALAVMDKETGGTFNVDAIGADGHDIGVFQIRKSNHAWLSEETGTDPLTPSGNIECGVWFLAYLYDYCSQNWSAALTCYRWGPGHGEDSEYARDVLSKAERWNEVVAK